MKSVRVGKLLINMKQHASISPVKIGKRYELHIYMMNGICLKEVFEDKISLMKRTMYIAKEANASEEDILELCEGIE